MLTNGKDFYLFFIRLRSENISSDTLMSVEVCLNHCTKEKESYIILAAHGRQNVFLSTTLFNILLKTDDTF